MVEVLKLDGPAFRVAGIEMVYIEFFVHPGWFQRYVFKSFVHPVYLAAFGIKKGDHALLVFLFGATESKKHVAMLKDLTGFLVQP